MDSIILIVIGIAIGFSIAFILYLKEKQKRKRAEKVYIIKAATDSLPDVLKENITILWKTPEKTEERLTIEKLLGSGGQGKVYLVSNSKNEKYALKVFAPNSMQFLCGNTIIEEVYKRFLKEQLVEKLNHENIVHIHHFFQSITVQADTKKKTDLALPAYTMTLCDQTISQYVNEQRKIHKIKIIFEKPDVAKTVFKYLIDVTNGLVHIHSQKVIHRDIKPSNIMLKDGRACIADFGVAFWHDFVRTQNNQTISLKTLEPQGTPDYMAPEIQNDSPHYTLAADIYSLGISILEILFDTKNVRLSAKIKNDCKIWGNDTVKIVNATMDLIEKMCDCEPDRRPDTENIKQELSQIVAALDNPEIARDWIPSPSPSQSAEIIQQFNILNDKDIPVERRNQAFTSLIAAGVGEFTNTNLCQLNLQSLDLHNFLFNNTDISQANLQGANLLAAKLQEADLLAANLQAANLQEANLLGADLQQANLQGADLQEANLQEADLQGANLQQANLLGANLLAANLQGADLQQANLQQASLQGAILQEAKLQRANLQRAKLQEASLRKAKLQGTNLQGTKLQGAILQGAILVKAKLQEANLQGAILVKAKLLRADLLRANLLRANLQGADLQEANLQGADLQEANLQEADLQEAKLQEADLRGAILVKAKLQGADLQRANLQRANLQRANLPGAKLQGADLQRSNLQDVKMQEAKLQGANLDQTNVTIGQLCQCRRLDQIQGLPKETMLAIKERKQELMAWWNESENPPLPPQPEIQDKPV